MNHRELATALSSLTPDQVNTLVTAADSIRATDTALAGLSVKRRKRGPNKPKPAPEPAPVPKKSHKKAAAPAAKPLSSALDRLKAVKTGGVKSRKPPVQEDDED